MQTRQPPEVDVAGPSRLARSHRRFATGRWHKYPLPLVVAVLLVLLMAPPLVWLLLLSVRSGEGATLQHYVTVLTEARYLEPLGRSFYIAIAVALLSVLLAAPAAWAVSRSDMPLRQTIRASILASFVIPPFLGALAWILLASPNAGKLNEFYMWLTGADSGLVNIYSMSGLIFVITMYQFPLCFILIATALDSVPSEMEDAGMVLGAGPRRIARTITLPLVATAILGGFMLVFLESISLFGAPAMLAIPSGFHVITTQIYAFFQFPQRLELGAALSMPLLLVTMTIVYFQRRALGRRSYVTVTGKSGARRRTALGRWKWLFLAYCILLITTSVVLPMGMLLRVSLSRSWGRPFGLDNLSLEHYSFVLFTYSATRDALRNSLTLAILAATAAALLAAIIAYLHARKAFPGYQMLPTVTMAPVVIPGIVLAVGLFITYTRPPLVLYGTIWVLFVAYWTKFLPYAYINCNSAISSLDSELEDASRMVGASRGTTIRRITLPLMRGGIISAWMLVFMVSLRELSSSILLYTSNSRVLAVALLDLQGDGRYESAAVIGVILVFATLLIVAIAYRILGKNILEMKG